MPPDATVPPTPAARDLERAAVVGAGTMGAGIAQVAAQAGLDVLVYDVEERFLQRGREIVGSSLERLVARGRLTSDERDAVLGRLRFTTRLDDLADRQFVVEAVPEDLALKLDVFRRLHAICPPDTVLVTNTSSLSVTDIARGSGRPEQVAGMHFFNPPVLMRLVEVVRAETSDPATVQATVDLARRMGKSPAVCRDTPGFIVNRVARPFYLEALSLLAEGVADVATIDAALRGVGFPMGPFQLMDLIGIDVNFATTRSVYEQRFHEPRYRPSLIQESLVRAGHLGRKSGRGFYDYSTDPARVAQEWRSGASSGPDVDWAPWAPDAAPDHARVVGRVVSALVNEAFFALGEGVASAEDIDTAMQLGTNYPRGLIAWGEQVGLEVVLDTLLRVEDWYRDGRHAPAPLLRARVRGVSLSAESAAASTG